MDAETARDAAGAGKDRYNGRSRRALPNAEPMVDLAAHAKRL